MREHKSSYWQSITGEKLTNAYGVASLRTNQQRYVCQNYIKMRYIIMPIICLLFLLSSCGIYEEKCPGTTQVSVNN